MLSRIFAILAFMAFAPPAWAAPAPVSITAGSYVNGTMPLSWLDVSTVQQWRIRIGGSTFASPTRAQTTPSGVNRTFLLQPLAPATSYVITMFTMANGVTSSSESAALTVTGSVVPITYVMNAPGTALSVSGSTGGGGSASAVTVISSVLPAGAATAAAQATGNASLASLDGKTVVVNTGAVSVSSSALPAGAATEATLSSLNGKATVINTGAVSVSSSALPSGAATAANQASILSAFSNVTVNTHAITINAPTTGQTVNVSNTVGTTISGGVSVTNPATAAVQIAGSITNTVTVGTHAVTINSAATGLAVNVSNTVSLNVPATGLPVNVSNAVAINAPATGQTVNVSNTVNTTLQTAATGLAVNVSNTVTTQNTGGVSVTNPATAAVQVAGSITNTVTVGTHAVTINSAATGLAVNVSNTVTVTNSGGVSVTNPATAAVQIAGSVTNTVNVQGPVSSTVAVGTNPVLLGGRAATTIPTAVSDGALVPIQLTKHGRLVTANQAMPEAVTRTTTTISASTAETAILVSGTAGVFWDIDAISVINTDNATNTRIDFRAASGGPVVYSMGAAKAFGGFVFTPPVPLLQESAASNWTAQCSASTTDIRINIVAHQRK